MSSVNLVVVHNKRVWISSLHYRSLINLFNDRLVGISKLEKGDGSVDEGYMLIDTENKIIVNNQVAFSLQDLGENVGSKISKSWYWIDLMIS